MNYLDNLLFGFYPYICLTVFLLGSLIRFDRDQYSWKSDSSQLLRAGQLRWGSNLFHVGILFLMFGHLVGLGRGGHIVIRRRAVHEAVAHAPPGEVGNMPGRLKLGDNAGRKI